jgi:phosphoserine phosphatase RsbU/P
MSGAMAPPTADDVRRLEQIRGLTEVSRALTYATSLEAVLRLAVERAAALLNAQQSVIMLTDEAGLLHVRAAHGVEDERIRTFREPLNETLIGRLQGLFDGIGEECFLGVPLVVHGDVTGLLAVVRTTGEPCGEADEWLLSALADQAAVALEHARLEEEVRHQVQERVRAVDGVNAAKERALSMLAHDLRSPLNAVEGYSELLEMEVLGPMTDRQREAVGRIRMSGRHLLAVLENVMEIARLSAGAVRLNEEPVRVADVAEEAMQVVMHCAMAKSQSMESEAAPALVIRADPDRLRQVLVNLLGNAIKYTPPGGSIRLRAAATEHGGKSWGAISVVDTGPGIPADQHEAIFQPYYRITTTDGEPGTGLGLAICQELMRQMGGEIQVESEAGRGSTFTLRLPLVGAETAEGLSPVD